MIYHPGNDDYDDINHNGSGSSSSSPGGCGISNRPQQQQKPHPQHLFDTLQVMKRQEESACYSLVDHSPPHHPSVPASGIVPASPTAVVDTFCRSAMMKWCYEVSEACGYQKETVVIAMFYLDKFCLLSSSSSSSSTDNNNDILTNRNQYQLAAMTCLYTAVKVHECSAIMNLELVSKLSHYKHTPAAIERMEQRILLALQWYVNPPTPYSFARILVKLLPSHLIDEQECETILDMTMLQLDVLLQQQPVGVAIPSSSEKCNNSDLLSTIANGASQRRSSYLAYGALLNAIESVLPDQHHNFGFQVGFCQYVTSVSNILQLNKKKKPLQANNEESKLCQIRIALYEAIGDGEGNSSTGYDHVISRAATPAAVSDDTADDMDIDDDGDVDEEDDFSCNNYDLSAYHHNHHHNHHHGEEQKEIPISVYYDSPSSPRSFALAH